MAGATLFGSLQTAPVQQMVADFVSSDTLQITGVSGFVPTDLRVARIELRDKEGPWLTVNDARVRWSFTSLFTGRVAVEQVEASKIDVLRPPLPGEQPPAESSSGGFKLPVGVDVRSLSVPDLHVAATLGGVDSRWTVAGSGLVTADGTPSRVKLDMTRTDGPVARLAADVGFSLDTFSVDGQITAEESTKGGVVAAMIGRPDLDGMALKLVAKGDRSNGQADLTAAAGDAVSSNGSVRWEREGNATVISLQLSAVGPGLPDSPLARMLRNPATLNGEATFDDAGVLLVKRAALKLGPAQLDATARYDMAADRLEAAVSLQASEAGPLSDLAGGAKWRNLTLDVQATASDLATKPQASAIVKGSADDVALPMLGERAPPPGHVELAAKIGLAANGRLIIESFDATTPVAALKGSGGYMPATQAAEGKVVIDLAKLDALSVLTGVKLAGKGHLELDARSNKDGQKVDWQGQLEDLALEGMPPGLARETIKLSGSAGLQGNEAWHLDKVALSSPGFTFEMSGSGRQRTGQIDMTLALPRLGLLQGDIAGAASAKGKVLLTPTGGGLQFTVDLTGLSRGEISSQQLALVLDATLEGEAVRGRLKVDGDLANQPLKLDGRFERSAEGGILVPTFQGGWASASVDVTGLTVTPKGATGEGHLNMTRLEDLAPLIGTPLAGAIDLEIATEPDPAGKVKIALRGERIRSGTTGVGSLQLDATITDPMGAAVADAKIKAERLSGVADINRADATIKGDLKAFDVTLAVAGPVTNASLAAKIEPIQEEIRVALQRFEGRYRSIPVALNAPTRLQVAGQRVTVDPTALRLGGGRLTVAGVVDPAAGDLSVDITGLPLALVDAFAPDTGLEGTLQAKARVTGALANPKVQATYSASGVRIKRPETALLPAIAIQGSASLADQQAALDARVTAGRGASLAVKGKGALSQGTANVQISGTAELAPFSPALGLAVRNVTGTLRPDLSLNIANGSVMGSGTISLSNATLSLPDVGLRLSRGEALVALQGDTLRVQRLNFQTASDGTISASGSVRLDPGQGFPVELTVIAQRALVANRPDLIATASANVKIVGSTLNGFDVSGPVTIDRAEISIAAGQGAAYPTVAVREINRSSATGTGATPPTPPPPPPAGNQPPKPASATGVRLDLTVQAPQAVFVRGRGLDAEVGGQFTVTGDPSAPAVLGNLTLRRGEFNLVGHRLRFTRGNVSLVSATTIDPLLDFVASTTVQGTTIEVRITGPARAPKIELTSSPSLPQDEAMAMLLFGKPASGLSPFELVSAAQALAELTGALPSGGGILARLRGGLGLDQLSINSGGSGSATGTTVEGGRYVAPGVYVGARQGATGDSSRGVVEVEVFDNVKIQGDIGADSTGKVGVKMEWDY
ncbi:MAG: translocation/assembly module TamB domain-containing protein [Enhydrobacter sp.]|nr:translocation/assembly module TamB domain-containing protein [Enhydrobacter sp.]